MYLSNLQKVLQQNGWFYWPYFVLVGVAAVIQATYHQFDISLWVNSHHNSALDFTFKYLTHLGDGLFAAVVCGIILAFYRTHFWSSIFCLYIPTIVTQILKRVIFVDHLRPAAKMSTYTQLHFVEGITIHTQNSFPSGHSTGAFALFLFLALLIPNKKLGIVFLLLALLAALTRVYLLQHFFEDVFLGSVISVTCTTLLFTLFETKRATPK
jgi:membrane-associated phospholipid phosphatase